MEDKYQIELETERFKTEDMYTGGKKDLVLHNHPVIRQMREIRGILFGDGREQLPDSAVSLKELFLRENIDAYHINSQILIKIACALMWLLEELSGKNIFMGLGDLADIYTDPQSDYEEIYIRNAEKFQILTYEQDYEWYPEDERLLGEISFFDSESQSVADCRLIYKILVATSRGGVKIPPRFNERDYAEIFYKKMPHILKDFFADPDHFDRKRLKERLYQAYEEQKEEQNAPQEEDKTVSEKTVPERKENHKAILCMYIILRTNLKQSVKIGRLLYDLEDAITLESEMSGYDLYQGFVHGDGHIDVREMKEDPGNFRIQLKNRIRQYSAGEALIVAADYYANTIIPECEGRNADLRCIILFDGELQNSAQFQYGVAMMEGLKDLGVRIYLTSDQEYQGEACMRLQDLLQRQEDYYVVKSTAEI